MQLDLKPPEEKPAHSPHHREGENGAEQDRNDVRNLAHGLPAHAAFPKLRFNLRGRLKLHSIDSLCARGFDILRDIIRKKTFLRSASGLPRWRVDRSKAEVSSRPLHTTRRMHENAAEAGSSPEPSRNGLRSYSKAGRAGICAQCLASMDSGMRVSGRKIELQISQKFS